MAVVTVGREEDVAPGQALRVVVKGEPIAIFNAQGELYAIGDTCTHEEFSLSDGELVDDHTVECALHGPSLTSAAAPRSPPATLPTPTYPVWVEDGELKIEVEE